jgi:hypothetical protein
MHVNSAAQLVGLPPASGKLLRHDPLRSDWAVQYTNRSSATAAPRVARRQTAHLSEKPLRAGGAFAAHTRGTLTQVLRQNLEERRVVIRKEIAGKQARRKPDPQSCIGVGAQCCLRLSGVGGIARVVTVQHGGDARRDQPQVLIDRVEVSVESRLSQDLADPWLERIIGRAQPEPSQPATVKPLQLLARTYSPALSHFWSAHISRVPSGALPRWSTRRHYRGVRSNWC